ncbi:MAG: cupin domain-containing protein [Pseudomonadota bacterium]
MRIYLLHLIGICMIFSPQQLLASNTVPNEALAIIDHFGMQKIPHEGPWFLQTYKSDEIIEGALAERYSGVRYAYTAIYAVATRQEFSAMHRLRTDELWHFYGGHPAEVLMLYPNGSGEIKIFGADVLAGQHPQIMVPRGTWMGARPIGADDTAYTFASNTLSPGFEYADYEIGYRDELIEIYPQFKKKIVELTRDDSLTRPVASAVTEKPEITITEYIGRTADQRTDRISAARFTIPADTETPYSLNREGAEVLIVDSGKGGVWIGEEYSAIERGSVVYLPAGIKHRVTAQTDLVLYAIVSPAYSPDDNIIEEGS